jgi:hypothetical protein
MPISLGSGTVQASTPISNDDGGNEASRSGGVDYASGGEYLGEFGGAGPAVGYQGSGYGTYSDGGYEAPESSEGVANMVSAMNRQNLINKQIAARERAMYGGNPVTQGFGAGQTSINQLYKRAFNQPLPNIGFMGVGLNTLGSSVARGILDRVAAGGKPVYDPTGQIVGVMGEGLFGGEAYFGRPGFDPLQGGSSFDPDNQAYYASSYTGDMGGDDDGGPDIPRAPVTAITPAEEPVAAAVTPQYIRPAGGFFPEEGLYYRRGLLDEPVPGLLDFTARNQAFRRGMATDASLYQMPYDLTGYTLL